jgi:hypothetical protein
MGQEARVPAGFDERTTASPKDIEIAPAPLCTRQVGGVQYRRREGAPTPPASKTVMIS